MNISMSNKRQREPKQKTMRVSALVGLLLASGCQYRDPGESASLPPASSHLPTREPAVVRASDQWLGPWTGPEGTSLQLSQAGDGYAVVIQSLDGPATYAGKAVGDHIEFTRDGRTESIRASDGKGTGMKWLAEKTDCLTITKGEGYCRD